MIASVWVKIVVPKQAAEHKVGLQMTNGWVNTYVCQMDRMESITQRWLRDVGEGHTMKCE